MRAEGAARKTQNGISFQRSLDGLTVRCAVGLEMRRGSSGRMPGGKPGLAVTDSRRPKPQVLPPAKRDGAPLFERRPAEII